MANGILPQIGDFLSAFAQGRQGSDVRQERLTRGLQGQIQALPQGGVLGSEALRQLSIVNPQAATAIGDPLRALSKERKQAFFDDALATSKLVEAGFPEKAIERLQNRLIDIDRLGGDPAETLEGLSVLRDQGSDAFLKLVEPTLIVGRSDGFLPTSPTVSALDQAKIAKLNAETDRLARGDTAAKKIPAALLKDLSPSTRAKASAAFDAAGGGKDGVSAFNAQVVLSNTSAQREDAPELLKASYPNATPLELTQLQAAVDGAKTVESGLKQADGIRTEQRRLKKAEGFKNRAVQLIEGILANDELDDVLGSVEGAIDFRFQDSEAELISDIEETQNILTAENMDLMTGVLSESDIQILKNLSSGALSRKRTFKRFKEDANELLNKLRGAEFPDRGRTELPPGTVDNGDGSFTLPTGERVVPG
jgi:hypothetical protein